MSRQKVRDPYRRRDLDAKLIWFIYSHQLDRGYSPTVREIQAGLNYASPDAVQGRLARLRAEGRISGNSRTFRWMRFPTIETTWLGDIPVLGVVD